MADGDGEIVVTGRAQGAKLLAQRGFTGISDIVEASYGGFLSSLARTPNIARLLDGLGADWEAGKVGREKQLGLRYPPFAFCGLTGEEHPGPVSRLG